MKKVLSGCLISFLLITSVHAALPAGGCGVLYIQIKNSTKYDCNLTNVKLVHGEVANREYSQPESYIAAGKSTLLYTYGLSQTGYGPELILSYQCGPHTLTFQSKQNYCALEAGNISGTVLFPVENSRPFHPYATYTSKPGSWHRDWPGRIIWEIR